jgi:endonuclease/exonuclease/phosphatase family metal-dependent hydrolase
MSLRALRPVRVLVPFVLVFLAQQPSAPIDVMSFNIRYGTANDGENRWANRRGFLIDLLKEHDADLIGLQEALDSQVRELLDDLPAYAAVGVGRDDGARRGEYAAILFRRDRFNVSDSGTFWFSDTPEVIASRSWGNTITRICTWARFVDRGGRAFWHFNVHLDHQSQPSRKPALLIDTFRARHPDEKVAGTFTGFVAGQTGGPKIDYVLVTPGMDVLDAAIVRTSRDGRYPSDHFPVTARVQLR